MDVANERTRFVIQDCQFENCSAQRGAVVYATAHGQVDITCCTFAQCNNTFFSNWANVHVDSCNFVDSPVVWQAIDGNITLTNWWTTSVYALPIGNVSQPKSTPIECAPLPFGWSAPPSSTTATALASEVSGHTTGKHQRSADTLTNLALGFPCICARCNNQAQCPKISAAHSLGTHLSCACKGGVFFTGAQVHRGVMHHRCKCGGQKGRLARGWQRRTRGQ